MADNQVEKSVDGFGVLSQRLDLLTAQLGEISRLVTETRSLVGPFGVPMPSGNMLVQTLHGLKYLIDPTDLIMAPQLIVYRQWEPDLSALFNDILRPDSVVVDVGANFGYFTCLAGARIGTTGKGQVFAFEPNPHMVELLRANCAINWSMCPIAVHPVAVGATKQTVQLAVPRGRAANGSLSRPQDTDGETDCFMVELDSIDSMVPSDVVVDVMKIDVEGHEANVLRGAQETLARSPNALIIMEWSMEQMKTANQSWQAMMGIFTDLRLACYLVPPTGKLSDAVELSPETLQQTPYANLLLRQRAS